MITFSVFLQSAYMQTRAGKGTAKGHYKKLTAWLGGQLGGAEHRAWGAAAPPCPPASYAHDP